MDMEANSSTAADRRASLFDLMRSTSDLVHNYSTENEAKFFNALAALQPKHKTLEHASPLEELDYIHTTQALPFILSATLTESVRSNVLLERDQSLTLISQMMRECILSCEGKIIRERTWDKLPNFDCINSYEDRYYYRVNFEMLYEKRSTLKELCNRRLPQNDIFTYILVPDNTLVKFDSHLPVSK